MDEVLVMPLVGHAKTPTLAHEDDVGFDLYCADNWSIAPGHRVDVACGVAIALPPNLYGRITGRSSSVRKGLLVHEGIIDPGYRGPLLAYVSNLTNEYITIKQGDRIAQLIFAPAIRPGLTVTYSLPDSDRGHGGLGSTGA